MDCQPRHLLLELRPAEHLDPAVNVSHGVSKGLVVSLVNERDDAVPGGQVGHCEHQHQAVFHAAPEAGGAEVEEHAVRHSPGHVPSYS